MTPDERSDSLLDASILPDEILRKPELAPGPRRLFAAVLEEAIVTLLGSGTAADEAAAWIASGERRHAFAFEPLCESLDLDPAAIRTAVLGRRRRLRTPAGAAASIRRRIPRSFRESPEGTRHGERG